MLVVLSLFVSIKYIDLFVRAEYWEDWGYKKNRHHPEYQNLLWALETILQHRNRSIQVRHFLYIKWLVLHDFQIWDVFSSWRPEKIAI